MKKNNLQIFFTGFLILVEVIIHFICFNNFNTFLPILFCIPIGILLGTICSLTKKELINKVLYWLLIVIITVLYCAEMIYFKMYESFFSLSAVLMAGQVKEGADQIITVINNNIGYLFLMIIPLVLNILFYKKLRVTKPKNYYLYLSLAVIFILHGLSLLYISFDKDDIYSNYQIYNNVTSPIISVDRFGVLTTLRLDIEKGFSNSSNSLLNNSNTETPVVEDEKIKYNKTEIDWNAIIENEDNSSIKQIDTYFSTQNASEQNEYTGVFKDKNVIFILAESLYKPVISEDLTPTLYKMMNEGFNFTNYYVPLYPTSTADGEYMLEWSLYPIVGNAYNLYNSRNNFHPYGFVNTYSALDYKVSAFHGFTSYYYNREEYFKSLGYDDYGFCDTVLNMSCNNFHASDLKMVENSLQRYINEDKFFTYYVSISGHGKYDYDANAIVRQNWDFVKDLAYSDYLKGYLAGTLEFERALKYLTEELEKAGKLDDTVFVISPDHWPYYFKTRMDELEVITGDSIYDKFDLHKNALIIYNSAMKESVKVDKISSNIDVLPTVLNLMGINYDSRLLMGKDILSNSDSLVIFSDYSWITDLGRYDGKTFTPINNEIEIADNYVENINNIVNQKILVSSLIQKNNYYKSLFTDIETLKKQENIETSDNESEN